MNAGEAVGHLTGSAIGSGVGSMTGSALAQFARALAEQMNNVGATLSGDASIALNNGASQLNTLTQQFEAMLREDVNKPINQLSAQIQDAAVQLNSAITRFDLILDAQQDRLYENMAVFVAGIESAALEAKRGFLFTPSGSSRLYYYQFSGQTAYMTPKEGGRATIVGYRLWEKTAPFVELVDKDRRSVAKLAPGRAANDNSVSVVLNAEFIKQHAGECLEFHVQPRNGSSVLADRYLPICIPKDYVTQFKVVASIEYPVTTPSRRELPPQNFRADNDSCEDRHTVAIDHTWQVPEGFKIVDFKDREVERRNQSAINLQVTGTNKISAAGWIDTATCVNAVFGRKLLHSSIWSHDVTPIIEGPNTKQTTANGQSLPKELTPPETQVLVDVPKSNTETTGTFWFTVVPVINGSDAKPIYESPHRALSETTNVPAARVGRYVITGSCNPRPVNGKAQVAVTILTGR